MTFGSIRTHNVSAIFAGGGTLGVADSDGVAGLVGVTETSGGESAWGGGSLLQATVSASTAAASAALRVRLITHRD
jgi:hypothetical protein